MSAKKKPMRVRVMFEANRLSQWYLADAYERLVPLIREGIKSKHPGKTMSKAIPTARNKIKGGQR